MVPRIEAKLWNPALEKSILQKWDSNGIYKFSVDESRKAFVIDTPPPYPSGRPWHIGAAASLCTNRYDRKNFQDDGVQCVIPDRH